MLWRKVSTSRQSRDQPPGSLVYLVSSHSNICTTLVRVSEDDSCLMKHGVIANLLEFPWTPATVVMEDSAEAIMNECQTWRSQLQEKSCCWFELQRQSTRVKVLIQEQEQNGLTLNQHLQTGAVILTHLGRFAFRKIARMLLELTTCLGLSPWPPELSWPPAI